MENVRNRIDVRPLANSKSNQKLVSKPNFLPKKISSKCFVAVHIIKEVNQRLRYLTFIKKYGHCDKLLVTDKRKFNIRN